MQPRSLVYNCSIHDSFSCQILFMQARKDEEVGFRELFHFPYTCRSGFLLQKVVQESLRVTVVATAFSNSNTVYLAISGLHQHY